MDFPCKKDLNYVTENFPFEECKNCNHQKLEDDGLCTCDIMMKNIKGE